MDQEVKEISIDKLVLWTENPRDPIDSNATDQDIVDRALKDKYAKWTLTKLSKEMGDYYDYSELPTVVYHDSKPVVYDGNRRIILAKIKHGCVHIDGEENIDLPAFPKKIPCNVCTKEIALKNVLRKHGNSGTWSPLDRDIFLNKFMNQPKSTFLKLEESTGLITSNPHLNQGFVKKEIFAIHKFNEMGFDFEDDILVSKHSDEETKAIFDDISTQVALKNITTRNERGQIISLLSNSNRDIIERNKSNSPKPIAVNFNPTALTKVPRQTRRVKPKDIEFFGSKLYLKPGNVSNLYRDIVDLHNFYSTNKKHLSPTFSAIIRMSLRLLSETAAKEQNLGLEAYLRANFANAKKTLDSDLKTTLSNQNVTESSITQLLQTGAHNYQASSNFEQTLAVSIILGSIINITHGK